MHAGVHAALIGAAGGADRVIALIARVGAAVAGAAVVGERAKVPAAAENSSNDGGQ